MMHQSHGRIIKYHNAPLGQWMLWMWGKTMTLQVLSAYIHFDVHVCVCVCVCVCALVDMKVGMCKV